MIQPVGPYIILMGKLDHPSALISYAIFAFMRRFDVLYGGHQQHPSAPFFSTQIFGTTSTYNADNADT